MRWRNCLALLLSVLGTAGCRGPEPANQAPPPPEVTVGKPLERSLVDYREYTGRIEAIQTVEIRARVKGFLNKVLFQEGVEVPEGQVLYEIDPSTFQADVEQAKAQVEKLKTQAQLAASEASRAALLRDRRATSEEEYAQKIAAREAAEAAVRQAQAAVKSAELERSFTTIRAPIAGRVSRTLVTKGNLVGFAEPTLLTTVVQVKPIYVYFEAPEIDFLDYHQLIRKQGALSAAEAKIPVQVGLATEQEFPHEGILDFRDNRIDPGTGTIQLRGSLPNDDKAMVPGLFVRVRVPFGKAKPRLLVPEVAVATDQRGSYLLLVKSDDTVEYRPVTLGRAEQGLIIIDKGFKAGERVVVDGLQRARPGSQVTPRESGESMEALAQRAARPARAGQTPNSPSSGAAK